MRFFDARSFVRDAPPSVVAFWNASVEINRPSESNSVNRQASMAFYRYVEGHHLGLDYGQP